MTDILAGATIQANDRPAAVANGDGTTITNITDTTFVTGTPVVETTFTAPTTGRVLVTISAGMRDNTNNNRVVCAYEIYEGTSSAGTLVVSTVSTLETELTSPGEADAFYYVSRISLQEGLTAEATHYIRFMYKAETATSASADISRRDVVVVPAS